MHGRGGVCPARSFAVITKLRVIRRHGYYAARCNRTGYYNITGKPHGTHICVPYKPAENTASSRNIATNKSLRGRGGVCPARSFAVITKLRVICRGGIYAARCRRPNITIYRKNRTGRIYASPTNLPGTGILPIIACLPVICREGSRPLLAALRLQQHNGSFVGAVIDRPRSRPDEST